MHTITLADGASAITLARPREKGAGTAIGIPVTGSVAGTGSPAAASRSASGAATAGQSAAARRSGLTSPSASETCVTATGSEYQRASTHAAP